MRKSYKDVKVGCNRLRKIFGVNIDCHKENNAIVLHNVEQTTNYRYGLKLVEAIYFLDGMEAAVALMQCPAGFDHSDHYGNHQNAKNNHPNG